VIFCRRKPPVKIAHYISDCSAGQPLERSAVFMAVKVKIIIGIENGDIYSR